MLSLLGFPLWYSETEEERGSSSQVVDPDRAASRRWRVSRLVFQPILRSSGTTSSMSQAWSIRFPNGAFEFLIAEPKEIVPEFQIVDAVREGKIPAGYTWLGYDQGKIPASPLLGAVPFGLEPWEFSSWWFEGGGEQLAQELYERDGVHILLCGLIGPENGWLVPGTY